MIVPRRQAQLGFIVSFLGADWMEELAVFGCAACVLGRPSLDTSRHAGPSEVCFKREVDLLGQDLARRSIGKALAWRSIEAINQLLELGSRYLCDVRIRGQKASYSAVTVFHAALLPWR